MDDNTQAVLLLACHFPGVKAPEHSPLTATEYGRFAFWMKNSGWQPHDLFIDSETMLKEWLDPKGKISAERVQYLLGRGVALALAAEKDEAARAADPVGWETKKRLQKRLSIDTRLAGI